MYVEEYKNYKGNEFNSRIEQEMVADILGEKLGNQEFVSHIVNTNNSVARNIYNWVVDKLNRINKLTGYKFEKLYWADVKSKFDKAFNTNFNNYINDVKYAKEGDIIDNDSDKEYNGNDLDLSTVKEGELVNDFYKALTKKQWAEYHKKMNKIMGSTRDNVTNTMIIGGKIITTEIKASNQYFKSKRGNYSKSKYICKGDSKQIWI